MSCASLLETVTEKLAIEGRLLTIYNKDQLLSVIFCYFGMVK